MAVAFTIREATAADAPVLSEIERRSPLVTSAGLLTIDRGEDYFAAARLQEEVTVLVAEVADRPVAVFCGALHPARLGGREIRALYIHHARIPPEFQRQGIGHALAAELYRRYEGRFDTAYWYIAKANAPSQGFARAAENRWSFGPLLLDLDTEAIAGPGVGRACTPGDAEEVVAILNATHGEEEMFLPYTPERLAARLARAPAQYGWAHLRRTEGAVVGVWPEGETVVMRLERPDGTVTESRAGVVLDYGCLPGREAELVALLRAWASELASRGFDTLSLFTWPGAPLEPALRALASRVEPFDFWTPAIPEPAGARERGLYVDPVYF